VGLGTAEEGDGKGKRGGNLFGWVFLFSCEKGGSKKGK